MLDTQEYRTKQTQNGDNYQIISKKMCRYEKRAQANRYAVYEDH